MIVRPLRRFVQVGSRRRALVIEATVWLLLARLALIFVPFPRIAQRLGTFVPPSDARVARARMSAPQEQSLLAQEVGWAVTRSARYVPFKAVCLPQAMAARVMLKRRGVDSVLHFGAAKNRALGKDEPLHAHAWLDAAGVDVTGYRAASGFTEIACFV